MPQVQVTQNPVVVVLIVGVICIAVIVALLLAGPWTARVPRPSRPLAEDEREPQAPISAPPAEPREGDGSPTPAWDSTRNTPPGHD
jgi:hypothetical protein